MADEKKIGAYICTGCGIGDRLDAKQLEMTAQRDGKAQVVKTHEFLCSADGVKTIQDDIDNDGVNRVVICACSRRAKTDAFAFDGVTLSRANLREGVIWVRPDNDEAQETTQEMADDYVRMACAEAKYLDVPETNENHGNNLRILVVGGGITGMTAALESAKAGYEVLLVEKGPELGGWMRKLHKRIPDRAPFDEPMDTGIDDLVEAIDASDKITVALNSRIARTSGAPGQFSVDIATESGSTNTENVGAIIQATGFKLYDPASLPEFGYSNADVITNAELEELAQAANGGPIKRPSDGKEVKAVAFVQDVGQNSTDVGKLRYDSGAGDLVAIKQAMYFKHHNGDDCDTTIIYDNLRTPGTAGEDFYRSGQRKEVIFTKGAVSKVDAAGDSLKVNFYDKILDEDAEMEADLVVLDMGMIPVTGPDPYATLEISTEDQEAAEAEAEEKEEGVEAENSVEVSVESILNLDYRQGTDLPQLKFGFLDSHFICFPYETRRTGIYAAGPVRRPMDIGQAIDDATGAALKAIQAAENAQVGRAAHPRSGDLSFPSFRKEGCTQCKRCTVECPFGAIDEDSEGYPQYNEGRCRRCGTCMGACPVRVISFKNYSVETIGQQLKAVDIPDEFDEKPRLMVLACENDAYPALDMAAMNRIEYSAYVRVIPVRCLGSVNTIWITDALNSGYDGIILMGCKKGDDYQCHFVKGSEIAHMRMSKIDDTLNQLNLEKERVATYEIEITDIERAPKLINDMAATIEEIGMSPFKF